MTEFRFDFTPKDALQVLERRTAAPRPLFSWLDIWQGEHAKGFTVAKTAGFDLLKDISDAVDDALRRGTTLEDFRKRLEPILREKGWWGRGPALDPETGEMIEAQLGSPRRLKTIFDTNMRQSYAAGRWAAIDRVKADRPYLQYVHTTAVKPRKEHLAWNGVTLPVDDPFWDTHYPPNGWGCKCSVVSLSSRQYEEALSKGRIRTDRPAIETVPFVNARTGEETMIPKGIDPGFAYNPGKAFLASGRNRR